VDGLRDIRPLVDIPDLSFYLYLAVVTVVTLLVVVFLYWIIRLVGRKRITREKEILTHLRSLDRRDSKRVAYEITLKGRYLVKDSATLKIYEELLRRLAPYKYRKEVPPIDEETNRYIDLFLKMRDDG